MHEHDSGAGKCSKYVKLCIDAEQIEFYTLTRQHILYSIYARENIIYNNIINLLNTLRKQCL